MFAVTQSVKLIEFMIVTVWLITDQTPLQLQHYPYEVNAHTVLIIVPGEGQVPLSVYRAEDAEYVSFPTFYCGQRRQQQ